MTQSFCDSRRYSSQNHRPLPPVFGGKTSLTSIAAARPPALPLAGIALVFGLMFDHAEVINSERAAPADSTFLFHGPATRGSLDPLPTVRMSARPTSQPKPGTLWLNARPNSA